MAEVDQLSFDVRGDIFEVNGQRTYEPGNWRQGTLTINVSNGAGKWIDLVVESVYPEWHRMWQTGHMNDSSQTGWSAPLTYHVNKSVKVTRWAPGWFGGAGNGGGEFFFAVPDDGDVVINISVTG